MKLPSTIWLLLTGAMFSLLLMVVAVHSYRSSFPVAEEILRSQAFSLSETIESLIVKDPSLALIRELKSPDIAFFAVIDADGVQRFHTNPDLIGSRVEEQHLTLDIRSAGYREKRITLGTGEEVFEFVRSLHLPGRAMGVRLALHTHRSDAVINRARTSLVIISSLLVAAWVMGILLYRFARAAERHRFEMAERENLARLGTMGAVLAHEVRNPLSGIKGYAQLLREQSPGGEASEYTGYIIDESVRLEGLVNDLLAFSRTAQNRVESVAVEEVLSRAIALVQTAAREQGIVLERRVPAELTVRADRDKLVQVLLNLLQNAVQALPDGGVITIGAAPEDTRIAITVGDTGPGIAPSEQERIFEPFFTTRARGSGLGLAISRKFVDEMQGSIQVSSRQGSGSVFRISLPAAGKRGGNRP